MLRRGNPNAKERVHYIAEMGHKVTCSQCRACNGTSFKGKTRGVVIDVHGYQAKRYIKLRAA